MQRKRQAKRRLTRKQTSDRVSSIAARGLRTGKLTPKEIRAVSASALAQDETKGKKRR